MDENTKTLCNGLITNNNIIIIEIEEHIQTCFVVSVKIVRLK